MLAVFICDCALVDGHLQNPLIESLDTGGVGDYQIHFNPKILGNGQPEKQFVMIVMKSDTVDLTQYESIEGVAMLPRVARFKNMPSLPDQALSRLTSAFDKHSISSAVMSGKVIDVIDGILNHLGNPDSTSFHLRIFADSEWGN